MHFGRSGGRYEEVLLIVILHFLARIWKGTPDAVDSLCLCWRDPLHIHGLFPPFQKYKLCKPGNFFPLKSQLQSFDSYFHHVMDCFLYVWVCGCIFISLELLEFFFLFHHPLVVEILACFSFEQSLLFFFLSGEVFISGTLYIWMVRAGDRI